MPLAPHFHFFGGPSATLGLVGLLVGLTLPARAQENPNPSPRVATGFTTLSDVAGPFLGNVDGTGSTYHLGTPSIGIVGVSSLDTTVRDIFTAPPQLDLGEVIKICIHTSNSMDKMSPFSGCSTVNWKIYNRAVRDTKSLRKVLSETVKQQLGLLKAGPLPGERQLILQKLVLLEKTTSSLEATTATLVALGQAMDKAR